MKFLQLVGVAVLSLAAITSCKKEDVKPPFAIEGTWEGKIGTGSTKPDGYFGIVVKPGGILDRLKNDGSVSASGKWQLNGNTFTGDYTFSDGVKVTLTGMVLKSENKLDGTWTNSGNNSGTLYASK